MPFTNISSTIAEADKNGCDKAFSLHATKNLAVINADKFEGCTWAFSSRKIPATCVTLALQYIFLFLLEHLHLILFLNSDIKV